MARWLIILALLLQALAPHPRCAGPEACLAACPETTCCASAEPEDQSTPSCCTGAACCSSEAPTRPDPTPSPCPSPCGCCCNWVACCLFDPDAALAGAGRGGSAETPESVVIAALPASAPSYPILSETLVAIPRPSPLAERIPAIACPPRSVTNVWTI